MEVMKKIKYSAVAVAASTVLATGSVAPVMLPVTVYAADYNYVVTVNYTGGKQTIKGSDAISFTQDEIKKDITGMVNLTSGTPLSFPGTIKMDQVCVIRRSDWNTYVNNTNKITKDGISSKTINVDSNEFTTAILGTASKLKVPLTVVVFDSEGNIYGTGAFNLVCELEKETETVIDGLDYETIISMITELQGKVSSLKESGYGELAEKINAASAELDAESLAASITDAETKIASLEAKKAALDPESASYDEEIKKIDSEIASLTDTKTSAQALQEEYLQVIKTKNELTDRFNSIKEDYNKVQAELDNLHATAGSANIGFAGTLNGIPVVYINGKAFEYDLNSGVEYTYLDDNSREHTAVKYLAKDGFSFYITMEGINVINKDGSITLYDETLPETLLKADAMLEEISAELITMQTSLNDFYSSMSELVGDNAVTGSTATDVLSNITSAVKELVTDYNSTKSSYVGLVKALNGSLTTADIEKLKKDDVTKMIKDLKKEAQTVQDTIQKALTGSTVSDSNRQSLEELSNNISSMVDKLETDEKTISALLSAIGEEDVDSAIKKALGLRTEIDKLTSDIETLTKSNDDIAKKYAELKKNENINASKENTSVSKDKDKDVKDKDVKDKDKDKETDTKDKTSKDKNSKNTDSENKKDKTSKDSSASKDNKESSTDTKKVEKKETLKTDSTDNTTTKTTDKSTSKSSKNAADSTYATTIADLQKKLTTLQSDYSKLSSKVASASSAANSANSKASQAMSKASSAPSSNSGANAATVSNLQSKVNELSTKVTQLQNNANKTTASSGNGNTTTTTTTTRSSNSKKEEDKPTKLKEKEKEKAEEKATVEVSAEEPTNGIAAVETEEKGKIDGEFNLNGPDEEDDTPAEPDIVEEVEEPSSVNVGGVIFLIGLLSIILGIGGFIVYKLFIKKPKANETLDTLMEDDEEEYDFEEDETIDGEEEEVQDNGPEIDDSEYDEDDDDEEYAV